MAENVLVISLQKASPYQLTHPCSGQRRVLFTLFHIHEVKDAQIDQCQCQKRETRPFKLAINGRTNTSVVPLGSQQLIIINSYIMWHICHTGPCELAVIVTNNNTL